MTTYDPDSLAQDPNVLKEIVQKFNGELALNCFVFRSGELKLGDSVELSADCDANVRIQPRLRNVVILIAYP